MMRPELYNRDACSETILQRLAEGESLRTICKEDGMPAASTFVKWVIEDPELGERYARARAIGYDVMAEEIIAIADTPQVGTKTISKATGMEVTEADMIEHRRLQVDARKWILSKRAPERYGDRMTLAGDANAPIETRAVLDASGLPTEVLAAIMAAKDKQG